MWIMELEAARTHTTKPLHKTTPSKSALSLTTVPALLCQWLSFVAALAEHPCARSLDMESWARLLSSVVSVMGEPRDATRQLELVYTALHVFVGARGAGVVPPGVWRRVRHVATQLGSVETQLHPILAGHAEMSALVYLVRNPSPASKSGTAEGRVLLLSAVAKDLLSVSEESQSSPRQYARFVQGMLMGRTPLIQHIVTQLVRDCQAQMALLTLRGPTIRCTNAQILQDAFQWAIRATIDEGLLDVSHRSDVSATLPWDLSTTQQKPSLGGLP